MGKQDQCKEQDNTSKVEDKLKPHASTNSGIISMEEESISL
jgi:hypothetical protein